MDFGRFRKVCSFANAGVEYRAGMLFLATNTKGLGLMITSGLDGPDPAGFLDAFVASVRIK